MSASVWTTMRTIGDGALIFRLLIALILVLFSIFVTVPPDHASWSAFLAIGTYVLLVLGLSWYERARRMLGALASLSTYLADIAVITYTIYSLRGWESDLYLAYFIVILISVKGTNMRHNIYVGLTACGIYGFLVLRSSPDGTALSPEFLLRFPFLLIISIYTTMISARLGESEESLRRANVQLYEANERLEEKVEERTHELRDFVEQLRVMNELIRSSFRVAGLEAFWPMLSDKLKEFLNCERATFFVQDEAGNLDSIYADGLAEPIHLEAGSGIAGLGSKIKRTVISNDPYQDPNFHPNVDASSGFKTYNLMACPLIRDEEVTGVAEFLNKEGGFSQRDMAFLDRLAPELQIIYDKLKGDFERVNMEALLRKSDKLAALGRLMAGLAHEIKNPLTGILANAQLVKRFCAKRCPGAEEMKMLGDIETCVRHCDSLVKDLLIFARKPKEMHDWSDLNDIVEKSLKLFGKRFQLDKIDIGKEYASNPLMVRCNATEVQQVIVNLLGNARQAMKGGGALKIKTRRTTTGDFLREHPGARVSRQNIKASARPLAGQERMRAADEAPAAVVDIMDGGPGLSEEVLAHLFEPFFTTKGPEGGSGLGLSVSWEIVDQHGGLLHGENREDGGGSRFSLVLPMASGVEGSDAVVFCGLRELEERGAEEDDEGPANALLGPDDR